MKKIYPLIVVLTLVLSSLACSFTVTTPKASTGETKTFTVNEAVPAGVETVSLDIEMGAGKLTITGGAKSLVEGTIRYNVFGWKPEVTRDGGKVRIFQGALDEIKIPNDDVVNSWDLLLGTSPIELKVSAGAYEGSLDLSGVPLTNLDITDGASKATVEFNSVNPVEMDTFSYKTGASQVNLFGIGNANASKLKFDGGAGDFTLDFSGELKQDLAVDINSGISSIKIIIPENVPARITISGGLNNISPSGTWSITGNTYEKTGTGPRIDIFIQMGVGSLKLISQ
ncbi:MAG: toast rack family protein [Bellilinea sp.]